METKLNEVIFEGGNDSDVIGEQFLSSGYLVDSTLMMDRFLDRDKTIDLEKLELAIMLTVEHLENSIKIENPIYVFLGNMDVYFKIRGITSDNLDRILEESSFILGFCSSVADEYELNRKVNVQFKGKEI